MILHVVTFTWNEGVTDEQVAEFTAGLRALPATIPELRRYDAGPDLGLTPGNADFAVSALVDDEAGLRAYLDHPAHQEVVSGMRPMIASRTGAQIEASQA
jgi:hypothetical protein